MGITTLYKLALSLGWTTKKLENYLNENYVAFSGICWEEIPTGFSTIRKIIDSDKFFEIKKQVEGKEKLKEEAYLNKFINCASSNERLSEPKAKRRRPLRNGNAEKCQNFLRSGHVYYGTHEMYNPVKFANFDGAKYKKVSII